MDTHISTYGDVRVDAEGAIQYALHCARCGYDLRKLPVAGACPECGLSIQETVARHRRQGRELQYRVRLLRFLVIVGLLALVFAALFFTKSD